MKQCSYIMCDGYECTDEATDKVGKNWYCEEHAIAMETGVDPMFEDEVLSIEDAVVA